MSLLVRPCIALLTAALVLPCPSSAFETPLSDEAVREAYFLGQRNDESTAALLISYLRTLPPPKSGPYISEVELYTPYSQLVEISRLRNVGYSAQQALADYRSTSDTVIVRIRIDFTSTYGALELYRSGRLVDPPKQAPDATPPDYHRDFRAGLSLKDDKEEHWIEPLSIQILPTYWQASAHVPFTTLFPFGFSRTSSASAGVSDFANYTGNGWCCFVGWYVLLMYDANDISSDDATVEILTTDGQHIAVPFDLSRLR